MPQKDAHIEQGRHNIKFLDTIRNGEFFDWITTVSFYTALHYADSLLAIKNIHPEGHTDRLRIIAQEHSLFSKEYYKLYRKLMSKSILARYKPQSWRSEIRSDNIDEVFDALNSIKQRVK